MKNFKTCVVAIGNSDNKLTQKRWAQYCEFVEGLVDRYSTQIYAKTYSLTNACWQNAVFVFSVTEDMVPLFKRQLATAAEIFRQDSIAFVCGDTEMVVPPSEVEVPVGGYINNDGNVVTAIEVQHGISGTKKRG